MAHNPPRLKPFRLPDLTYPLVIDTVGKMLAMGNEISASCNTHGCRQHFRVNLVEEFDGA